MTRVTKIGTLSLLAVLLGTCASMIPSPTPSLDFIGEKLRLKVAVILPESLEKVEYVTSYTLRLPLGAEKRTITVPLGQPSIEMFRNGFSRLYQTVDFFPTEARDLSGYQLILIPKLSHFDLSFCKRAHATYALTIKDSQGTTLAAISKTSTAHFRHIQGFEEPCTFTTSQREVFGKAFERAMSRAFTEVLEELVVISKLREHF